MRSGLAVALILLLVAVYAPSARADETLTVQVNHGLLVKVRNAQRVVVAAPDVADVNLITRSELMVIAKKIGETTISVWDARGFTTYRVVVTGAPGPDVVRAITEALADPGIRVRLVGDTVVLEGRVKTEADRKRAEEIAKAFGKTVANAITVEQPPVAPTASQALEARLREAFRGLPVTVRALDGETVLIEGTVPTQAELRRLEAIAKALAKNVVVLVRISAPVQFKVEAFVAEVDRQELRQMGVEWGGGNVSDLLTDPYAFHFGNLNQDAPLTPLQLLVARLRLLESRGAARTLANPRLSVMEGQPARLLIGGEIPIPVITPTGVAVQFKEFGVRLEFRATAQGNEPMTLELETEVSSLDFSNAIVAGGFVIPTIRSRKVKTMVSMRTGEFLVLGGLIQRDESRTVQKVPVLGDIPILGALFRSVRFQRGETELVVFVSPSRTAPTPEAPKLPEAPSAP